MGAADAPFLDEAHPWPGLASFDEAGAPYFFGRSVEEDQLLRLVQRETTTLLFGQSGLGKTSLLQASLAPRLRERGYLPFIVRLDHAEEAPALIDQVRAALAKASENLGSGLAPLQAAEGLWEYLHRRDLHGERVAQPTLILDQFEEIFTLGLANDLRRARSQAFLVELSDLIENRRPASLDARLEADPDLADRFALGGQPYRIVVSMREDYLPLLESVRARAPTLGDNRFRLTRMNGRQALEAVRGPGGSLVDQPVAREIVGAVGSRHVDDPFGLALSRQSDEIAELEVEPSLLSLFCQQLNEERISAGQARITHELLEENRHEILERFYDRAFEDQPAALRAFVEDWLLTDSGVRCDVTRERAAQELARQGVAAASLDELVRRRILHVEDRLNVPRVELIHDVLAEVAARSRARRRGVEQQQRLQREVAEANAREAALRQTYARRRRRVMAGAVVGGVAVTAVIATLAFALNESKNATVEKAQQLQAEKESLASENRFALSEKKIADKDYQLSIAYQRLTADRDTLSKQFVEQKKESAALSASNNDLKSTTEYLNNVFLATTIDSSKKLGDYHAEEEYEQASHAMPSRPEAYVGLSRIYENRQQYQKALAELNIAIKSQASSVTAFVERGFVLQDLGEWKRSIADFQRAIEMTHEKYSNPFVGIAWAYYKMGDTKDALSWFDKAIALDPRYPNAYNLRALVEEDAADYTSARVDLDESLKLYSSFSDAQNNYGVLYENGWAVPKDSATAMAWYRKAAAEGNATAAKNIGRMFQNGGPGVTQDYSVALTWYENAAAEGEAEANERIGVMYENGLGVKSDLSAAMEWYLKAVAGGDRAALHRIFSLRESNPQVVAKIRPEVLRDLQDVAEQGNGEIQDDVGWLYQHGWGVKQDNREALTWYLRAAAQGDADAQDNVGLLYENGEGLAQDYSKAMEWFRQAAAQGNSDGEVDLGYLFHEGRGVVQNDQVAAQWYEKSAKRGNARAEEALGYLYQFGLSAEQNYSKAAALYQDSAKQGNEDAENNLGVLYENGQGVEKNVGLAIDLFKQAAAQGDAQAFFNLGDVAEHGLDGRSPDYSQALTLYLKAVISGDQAAEPDLAELYVSGKGGSQPRSDVLAWFKAAAANGDELAARVLKLTTQQP